MHPHNPVNHFPSMPVWHTTEEIPLPSRYKYTISFGSLRVTEKFHSSQRITRIAFTPVLTIMESLAQHLNREADLKWIETQKQSFLKSMEMADDYNDMYDDFSMPVQQPIVKETKIYQTIRVRAAVEKI